LLSGGYGAVEDSKDSKDPESQKASKTAREKELERQARSRVLLLCFFAMIVAALGNRVFQKLQTLPMYHYPFFLNVLSVAFYVPLCFAYIVPMVAFGRAITPEQTAIPKRKFAIMGLLDALAGVMQIFAVNFITNASILVLLSQAAIPVSMAISRAFLGATYTWNQYIGAVIVVCGIVVVMLPAIEGENAEYAENQTFWMGMMVLSCVPMCLSSVYKEKALGEADIDVVYLNGWVALFQFVFTLFTAWPSAIAMHLPLSELPDNTMHGFWCWMGYNPPSEFVPQHIYSSISEASCSWAPFFVTSYLLFNVMLNVLMILILKYGSANILYMSSTALVPLSNVVFSLKFMPNAQRLHAADIEGLVVIMLGLIIYRFWKSFRKLVRKALRQYTRAEEQADRWAQDAEEREIPRTSTMVGLNQPADLLQPLIDTRVFRAQRKVLFRSPSQIRAGMLMRLGIPPSPHVRYAAGGHLERSPQLPENSIIRSPEGRQPSLGSPMLSSMQQARRNEMLPSPSQYRPIRPRSHDTDSINA